MENGVTCAKSSPKPQNKNPTRKNSLFFEILIFRAEIFCYIFESRTFHFPSQMELSRSNPYIFLYFPKWKLFLYFQERNFLALIFTKNYPHFLKWKLSYISQNTTLHFLAQALEIKELHPKNSESILYLIFFIRTFFHLNFFHNFLMRIFFIIRTFIHLNFFQQIFFISIRWYFYIIKNIIIKLLCLTTYLHPSKNTWG